MLADVAKLDDTRRNGLKLFSPRRRQLSLKLFPEDFLAPEERILKLPKFLLEYNVKTKFFHRKSVKLDDKSKCMPNNFFHWIIARFSKASVFNEDLRDTKRILKLAHTCVNALQNLKNLTGCWQTWWNE